MDERKILATHPAACPDCGSRLILYRCGNIIAYFCEFRLTKGCEGLASAHANGAPMGTAVPKETRQARMLLHELLDPYWKNAREKNKTRQHIYEILGNELGVEPFHIALLDLNQAKEAMKITQTTIRRLFG